MPELPEVETTVRDLQKKILGRKINNVWTDWKKMIRLRSLSFDGQVKKPSDFEQFKKEIKGRKIEKVKRRGKNILFKLSGGKTLLIHQKLTGHLLLGKWKYQQGNWKSLRPGPLEDPMNRFLHLIFWLDNEQQLALSDLRKFAKVELWDNKKLAESEEFKNLGPEPLEKSFTFQKFEEILGGKKAARGPLRPRSEASEPRQRRGKIKQILMDQTIISGIGNIYSDEILFEAKIHPFREAQRLTLPELRKIYQATKKILKKAIKLRGESISDFRDIEGKRGYFDKARKVYRREGESCPRCGTKIKRIKLGGRSAHYCPVCQL